MYGSLLGLIRDGSPIKGDSDNDFMIMEEDVERAKAALEEGLARVEGAPLKRVSFSENDRGPREMSFTAPNGVTEHDSDVRAHV